MKKLIFLAIITFAVHTTSAQFYSARVNALSLLVGTIDAGVDVAVKDNLTLDAAFQFNPIKTETTSFFHVGTEVGAKFWKFESFVGPFIATHIGLCKYDVGNKKSRYDGMAYRLGVSYGYSWILSLQWSVVVEAGLGVCYSDDTRTDATEYDDWAVEYLYHNKRVTLIPTRVGVTFNYLF